MLDVPKNSENNPEKSHADGKILQKIDDGVGVVTFNNPEKRNAMSLEMWEGFGHALIELRDNPDVRVVILTGAGDKAFVSGADISQFEKTRHNAEASEEYSRKSAAQRALLADYPKPVIACIRGFCLGGGMQVAMAADMRIASENSQYGISRPREPRHRLPRLGRPVEPDLAGRTVLGAAHHVYRHADRFRRGGADRTGRPRGARQ